MNTPAHFPPDRTSAAGDPPAAHRMSAPVKLAELQPGEVFFFARDFTPEASDHTAQRWRLMGQRSGHCMISRDPAPVGDTARHYPADTGTLVRRLE